MARGWESKSVEQQQDLASGEQQKGPLLTPEQAEHQRQITSLRMARTRVEQQMAVARNPHYRQTLEMELKALDAKLETLQAAE
jgi:hypothetical protein